MKIEREYGSFQQELGCSIYYLYKPALYGVNYIVPETHETLF